MKEQKTSAAIAKARVTTMTDFPFQRYGSAVQYPSRGGSRVTTFYCNAPGGVVIEIATLPGLAAE